MIVAKSVKSQSRGLPGELARLSSLRHTAAICVGVDLPYRVVIKKRSLRVPPCTQRADPFVRSERRAGSHRVRQAIRRRVGITREIDAVGNDRIARKDGRDCCRIG